MPKLCYLIMPTHCSRSEVLGECMYAVGVHAGLSRNRWSTTQHPNGNYENDVITLFNEKCLREIGTTWDSPDEIKEYPPEFKQKHIKELAKLIKREFKGQQRFFIKDPRIVKLFSIYEHALKHLKIKVHMVCMTREKQECCSVISEVHSIPHERAVELYNTTVRKLDFISAKYHQACTWVDTSDLLSSSTSSHQTTDSILSEILKEDVVVPPHIIQVANAR